MNYEKARALVAVEAHEEQGLVSVLRQGEFPASKRMENLLEALQAVFQYLQGHNVLDRKLADGLFGIGFHVEGQIDALIDKGVTIPSRFLEHQLMRLFLMIESIFADKWLLD